MRNPENSTGWDARCLNCGEVYIVWLPGDHEPGDVIGYAHIDTTGACGEYGDHELVGELSGIEHPAARQSG